MERELLFCILALEREVVTNEVVLKALVRKVGGQTEGILEGFFDEGLVSSTSRQSLEERIDEMISENGGDLKRALSAAGGTAHLTRLLCQDLDSAAWDQTLNAVNEFISEDGEQAATISEEFPGRYVLGVTENGTAELGRGGIGRVLVAFDTHLGREVAVKELLDDGLRLNRSMELRTSDISTANMARFLREARVTGQIEHPNIVPVYELGRRTNGTLYYTMKLVRGRTYHQVLSETRGLTDRLRLLSHYIDACQAIAYAHSRGVVHRDIKPQNVMLGEFGETVVLDWGLAKVRGRRDLRDRDIEREIRLYHEDQSQTMMGSAVGTPAYMSPEQARGEIDSVDETSDVWSLGVMLYETLTGNNPFAGGSASEVLRKVVELTIVPPHEVVPEVSPDLSSVCMKALQRDQKKRYSRAKELADEIEAYRAGRQVSAYDYTSVELVKRLVVKHKALTAMAALVLVILVSSSVVLYRSFRAEEASRQVAEEQQALAETREEEAESSRVLALRAQSGAEKSAREAHRNLAIALQEESNRLISKHNYLGAGVYAAAALVHTPANPASPHLTNGDEAETGEDSQEQLASLRTNLYLSEVYSRLRLKWTLREHARGVIRAQFVPGTPLVVSSGGGRTLLWNGDTGAVEREFGDAPEIAKYIAMDSKGQVVIAEDRSSVTRLYDIKTGIVLWSSPPQLGEVNCATLSPDGARIAIGRADNTLVVADWKRGGMKTLGEFPGALVELSISPDGRTLAAVGLNSSAQLYDLETGALQKEILTPSSSLFSAAWSPNGRYLALGGYDGAVRLWDTREGAFAWVLRTDAHTLALSFSPDGTMLASSCHDGQLFLWNVEQGELLSTAIVQKGSVRSVCFNDNGHSLLSAGQSGIVRTWGVEKPLAEDFAGLGGDSIYRATVSSDGTAVAFGFLGGKVAVWSREEDRFLFESDDMDSVYWTLAFSPDGKKVAAAGMSGQAMVWDMALGGPPKIIHTYERRATGFSFFGDRGEFATAGDRFVHLWNAEGKQQGEISVGDADIWSLASTPDGASILVGLSNGKVLVYDRKTMALRYAVEAHKDWVSSIQVHPDGTRFVTASRDATVKQWRMDTGALVSQYLGHEAWVNVALYSPDGSLLLTGSDDNSFRIWEVESQILLQRFSTAGEVTAMSFFPDGTEMVVGQGEKASILPVMSAQRWNQDPRILLKNLQDRCGMMLDGFTLTVI